MDPFLSDYNSHIRFAKMFVTPDQPDLLLPDAFKRAFGQERPCMVTLSMWDRKKWPVEVEFGGGSVTLGSGWCAFRDAYDLVNADILFFAYDRKLHFEVRAYSRSGMEKGTTVPVELMMESAITIGRGESALSNPIIESSGYEKGKRKVWTRNCTRGNLARDDEENAKRIRREGMIGNVEGSGLDRSAEFYGNLKIMGRVEYNRTEINDEELALTQPQIHTDIDAEVANIVGNETKLDEVMMAAIGLILESSTMVEKIEGDIYGTVGGEGTNMLQAIELDGTEAVVPVVNNGGKAFFVVVSPSMISGDFMMDVDMGFAEYEVPMGISPVELELKGVGTWTLICLRTDTECKIIDGLQDFAIASSVKVGDCCKFKCVGEGKWEITKFRP